MAPRENPNFVGHELAETSILSSVAAGRIHHAWLLLGPRGIGKATLAFRFARYLLAEPSADNAPSLTGALFGSEVTESPSLAVAPEHPVFQRVVAKGHSDLFVLDESDAKGRSSQISVDSVRRIGPFLRQTSGETGRRIVVIDALDEM